MTETETTLYAGLQDLSGARLVECNRPDETIDQDILRVARDRDVALPTAGDPDRSSYHGAVVFDPKPGLHQNVVYPDYSSLYPNFMRDLNISPETILGVGRGTLIRSSYTTDDVRRGYVDPRPVKELDDHEQFRDFTDGDYKMIVDPQTDSIKWRDDWERVQEHLEPIYFLSPSERAGILSSRAEEYIRWNKQYDGTMYSATKRVRNCFTSDTEVLTVDGVQNIRELDVGDEVYSLNPDTFEVEVKEVTETWSYAGTHDDLVSLQSRHFDFQVTPNHRMLVSQDWNDDGYTFVEAGDLRGNVSLPSDWDDGVESERFDELDLSQHADEYEVLVEPSVHGHTFADELGYYPDRRHRSKKWDVTSGYVLNADQFEDDRERITALSDRIFIHSGPGKGWVPLTYDGDDVVELLGWFATEGSTHTTERAEYDSAVRGKSHRVSIAQKDNAGRRQISALLVRMGLPQSESDNGFTFGNELWHQLLRDWCGEGSNEKRLPEWALRLPDDQTELLFDTLVAGDGDGRGRYTTKSDQLRDQFMQLAVRMGRNPRYHRSQGGSVWRIRYTETENAVRGRNIGTASTEDGVYCVTVADNYTLLAGRNGKFQWTGQSLYGVSGFQRFRLFDWRAAEAITIGGRMLLEYGRDVIVDRLAETFDPAVIDVVIGDTDGFGIAVNRDAPRDDVLSHVHDAVEWLNDEGMPQFVEEKFGVPRSETAHAVDVESYAPRLFVPEADDGSGTKKTYAERVTWDEGDECDELDIKGFEAKRSDVADVTADVQSAVLDAILTKPKAVAKQAVYELIRATVDEIRSGDRPLAAIGERSGMSKPPEQYGSANRSAHPTYRGAKYAKHNIDGEDEFDKPLKFPVDRVEDPYSSVYDTDTAEDGTRVDYVSVEDPDNLPPEIHVDREQVIESTLKQPLRSILRTMGWSWSEAVYRHEQAALTHY